MKYYLEHRNIIGAGKTGHNIGLLSYITAASPRVFYCILPLIGGTMLKSIIKRHILVIYIHMSSQKKFLDWDAVIEVVLWTGRWPSFHGRGAASVVNWRHTAYKVEIEYLHGK